MALNTYSILARPEGDPEHGPWQDPNETNPPPPPPTGTMTTSRAQCCKKPGNAAPSILRYIYFTIRFTIPALLVRRPSCMAFHHNPTAKTVKPPDALQPLLIVLPNLRPNTKGQKSAASMSAKYEGTAVYTCKKLMWIRVGAAGGRVFSNLACAGRTLTSGRRGSHGCTQGVMPPLSPIASVSPQRCGAPWNTKASCYLPTRPCHQSVSKLEENAMVTTQECVAPLAGLRPVASPRSHAYPIVSARHRRLACCCLPVQLSTPRHCLPKLPVLGCSSVRCASWGGTRLVQRQRSVCAAQNETAAWGEHVALPEQAPVHVAHQRWHLHSKSCLASQNWDADPAGLAKQLWGVKMNVTQLPKVSKVCVASSASGHRTVTTSLRYEPGGMFIHLWHAFFCSADTNAEHFLNIYIYMFKTYIETIFL